MSCTIPSIPSIPAVTSNAPKLLDQFRDAARSYGHTDAWAVEAADWCRRFVLFHGKRHPQEMGQGYVRFIFFNRGGATPGNRCAHAGAWADLSL